MIEISSPGKLNEIGLSVTAYDINAFARHSTVNEFVIIGVATYLIVLVWINETAGRNDTGERNTYWFVRIFGRMLSSLRRCFLPSR